MRGVAAFAVLAGACTPKAEKPARSAAPPHAKRAPAEALTPEPPLARLRTGTLSPLPPLDESVEVVRRSVTRDTEILAVSLQPVGGSAFGDSVAVVDGATLAFVAKQGNTPTLWVRRPLATSSEPVTGSLFLAAGGAPGREVRLSQRGALPKPSAALDAEFLEALAQTFTWRDTSTSPFAAFAARRLHEMASSKAKPGSARAHTEALSSSGPDALAELMATTTGRAALQHALMQDRRLALAASAKGRRVPIASVAPPAVPRLDYRTMLAGLGRSAPDEPLARAVPADFWYFRSRTLDAFLDVLDFFDRWGQPAADALDGSSIDWGTTARYLTELGLERTELARVLGPSAIDSVAVAGSDPYVHEGSDVTLLFAVKSAPLFEAALAKALAKHGAVHPGVTSSEETYAGVVVTTTRSADGRVRRRQASVAGLELVSNSPTAIRRVIDAALGRAPKLSDEPDLSFLLARDADAPDESLAFFGDRFILSVVGPAQKIAAARRELALGELTAPGVASLLFGWLNGRRPTDEKELVASGVLTRDELRHFDGGPIFYVPGAAPRSAYGSLDALEPLIDLPAVVKVTPDEKLAYERFAFAYAANWSSYVDPAALRVARSKEHPGRYSFALRALPLEPSLERELVSGTVGRARVAAPDSGAGFRMTLGLGKEASLRQELTRALSFGGYRFALDWVGDWVMVGVADRAELTSVAAPFVGPALEPPNEERVSDGFEGLLRLPAYAVLAVRNRVGAGIALGHLQKLAGDAAPDVFQFQQVGKHRGITVKEISAAPGGMVEKGASLFYALCPQALVFSLSRPVLDRLIDEQLEGRTPRAVSAKDPAQHGQLVMELGASPGGPLATALGWLLAAERVQSAERGRNAADAVLRGDPPARAGDDAFRAAARATLGFVPLTPDGALYRASREGTLDPARGTAYAPVYPETPVSGSPLALLLSRFGSLRSDVGFDTEPTGAPNAPRSFAARMTLQLRDEAR